MTVEDASRFQKGDLTVIPMASKAFLSNRSVFIYFEIYNLQRDTFGATRYRVSYEVLSLDGKRVAGSILSGLGGLLGKREEPSLMAIEFEQVGDQPDEAAYLELDMANSDRGTQKLTVTDEVAGTTSSSSTVFTLE